MALVIHRDMNESEVFKQVCHQVVLKMAKTYLEAYEMTGRLTEERLEVWKDEIKRLEQKIEKENNFYNGKGSITIETTDVKGKVVDSGDERSFDMQMSKKELKETVAEGTAQGIRIAESEESELLNAAR